ncbi:uncharacterized protein A1O5_05969 [Cladophialophora psammophila CBS 110553]|uniref:Oxidoreductase n=1 Tax=Cladophialophora psammophila CBS 110553 TaxID=1182543 RepID=W9X226_9EURO|nr:uncharacterized protein A1O5_05969 [Cladophialophora psammophila CBS 110553]EXJ70976.1 hypothetical protein A1O5_05969 [Cladophialophora psammophila CBS 110553]
MANLPSFTRTFHRDTYPAISPMRPEQSAAGKVVIVTGAAGRIGKATCIAFARAGAQHVAMLDLDGDNLQKAKAEIEQDPQCESSNLHLFPVDITNQAAVKETFSSIESTLGKVNVLVNNAGYQPSPKLYRDAEIDEWWKGFEINVKGSFIVTQEFVRRAAPALSDNAEPVLINISSVLAHWGIRQGYVNKQSAYSGAKMAMTRAMEILQEEEPWVRVVNVHPGLVVSPMSAKSGTLEYSIDNVNLPAHFAVWLASDEAQFTKGRFLWSNWDVSELQQRKEEILEHDLLRLKVDGL